MRAILSKVVGGPETLVMETVAEPQCAAGEIIIDVHACGLNYPDVIIIEDRYQYKPQRPFAPGSEVAGVVSAVGGDTTGFSIGDRVIGSVGWGGMVERVAVDATKCVKMPDAMPFDEGASLLMTFGTSYYALKQRARIKAGETLLVLGAAGGVGIAAVQLGKAMGAHVIAAVSSEDKAEFARSQGADSAVVYPREVSDADARKSLARLFKDAGGAQGIDVVYDAVGGPYSEAAFRALAWEGRFLVVGFPAGIASIPLNLPLLKGAAIVGVFYGAFTEREPAMTQQNISELFDFYSAGAIKPLVSERFAFEDGANAIRHLSDRRAKGKVVVTVRS